MERHGQIYIRYNVNIEPSWSTPTDPYVFHYVGLIARDNPWNFGVGMISRTRSILARLNAEYLPYRQVWGKPNYIEKLHRVCDINFDYQDVTLSSNILEELKNDFGNNSQKIFDRENYGGQLLIDVIDYSIKYCLIDPKNPHFPMDADAYMHWICTNEWDIPDQHLSKLDIQITKKNIKQIKSLAPLMTISEVEDFISSDYSTCVLA